jgi:hypothetical protein
MSAFDPKKLKIDDIVDVLATDCMVQETIIVDCN